MPVMGPGVKVGEKETIVVVLIVSTFRVSPEITLYEESWIDVDTGDSIYPGLLTLLRTIVLDLPAVQSAVPVEQKDYTGTET